MTSAIGTCGRCESPIEQGDLRCAICGTSVPPGEQHQHQHQQMMSIQVLRCNGCGAAVSYDVKKQAPQCDFCGSVMEVETVTDPMEQTEKYLPFSVPDEQADAALSGWLGSLGFFRPSDLKSNAQLESLKPLWWVGWLFDAEALISWTADSHAEAWRSDWAPHSGQADMTFRDIVVPASRGLSDAETIYLTSSYNLATAADAPNRSAETGEANEPAVEQFDVQRSMARKRITEAIDILAENEVKRGHIPGNHYRNVSVAAKLRRLITKRYAFPAFVMAYRYKEKLYRAVISGQDAEYVKGTAPYSWAKILMTIGLGVLIILIIVGIVIGTSGG